MHRVLNTVKQWIQGINRRYYYPCTAFHVNMILYSGYWPLLEGETNKYLRVMRGLPYLAGFGFLIVLGVCFYDISNKLHDYLLLAQTLSFTITVIKACVCNWTAVYKMDNICDIIMRINYFYPQLSNADELKTFTKYIDTAKYYTLMNMFSYTGFTFIFILIPLFEEQRQYPLHLNLPLNSPVYDILYFGTFLGGVGSVLILSAVDSIVVSAILYFTGYFKVLQLKLEHSRVTVTQMVLEGIQEKEVPVERISAMPLNFVRYNDTDGGNEHQMHVLSGNQCQEQQQVQENAFSNLPDTSSNDVVAQYLSLILDTATPHTIGDIGQTEGDTNVDKDTDYFDTEIGRRHLDLEMSRHIAKCVKFHSELTDTFDTIEATSRPLLFSHLLLGAVALCLTMFVTTGVQFGSLEMVLWFYFWVLMLVQLYGPCWASSELADESVKVSDALYFSDWTEASSSYKRSMLIMMSRALSPMQFSVATFLPFTMEMFTNVLNSGYSYFNVMNNLHTDGK